jgi:hypothetical protein
MALYARSDLMSVSIPAKSGGCGASHSRPVHAGAPAKEWELNCPDCEAYLKGDRKPKILKTTPGDPKLGIPAQQERVADGDPHWSSTPESAPLTPDEKRTNSVRTERATSQIQMIQALAALRAAGTDIPFETAWLMEKELPSSFVRGTTVCPNGHDNFAGAKFCSECAISMTKQKEIEPPPEEEVAEIPLDKLHVATLRKMCREHGLNDKGGKSEMIDRLEAARART